METKKIPYAWIGLAILAVGGYFLYSFVDKKPFSNELYGTVSEIGDGFVVIDGYLRGLPEISPGQPGEKVTVRLSVTDDTVIQKETMILDRAKLATGEFFTPEVVMADGQFSDMKIGTSVQSAVALKSLTGKSRGQAEKIIYSVMEYEGD